MSARAVDVLEHPARVDQVIDGGTVNTLGERFAFGTSITGRGAMVAPVTNSLAGGIHNGGPSTITHRRSRSWDHDPRSPQDGVALKTTFNVGAHRFTAVGTRRLRTPR
jgi:hypothetical protein